MTTLLALAIFALILAGVAALAVVLAVTGAKRQGRVEAEAEQNKRAAENAETLGRVIAQPVTVDETADKLDQRKF